MSKILYYCASRLEKARETARTWHSSTSVTSARSANDTMRVSRLIPTKSDDHKMHCGMTDWLLSSCQGAGRKPSKGRKILSIGFFVLEQSNRPCVKICTKSEGQHVNMFKKPKGQNATIPLCYTIGSNGNRLG